MDAELVLCVRSSSRQHWVPVPVTSRGAVKCATLSSTKSLWALKALTNGNKYRDMHDAAMVLRAFENEARTLVGLKSATSDSSDSGDSQPANKK